MDSPYTGIELSLPPLQSEAWSAVATPSQLSHLRGPQTTVVRQLVTLGFDVPKALRNDVWRWEELVLALDLYFRAKNLPAAEVENECQALSKVLDRMGSQTGAVKTETYRNRNGVRLKLMNFRRLDPALQRLAK
jgi:predicted HNH restriction endonuclease